MINKPKLDIAEIAPYMDLIRITGSVVIGTVIALTFIVPHLLHDAGMVSAETQYNATISGLAVAGTLSIIAFHMMDKIEVIFGIKLYNYVQAKAQ